MASLHGSRGVIRKFVTRPPWHTAMPNACAATSLGNAMRVVTGESGLQATSLSRSWTRGGHSQSAPRDQILRDLRDLLPRPLDADVRRQPAVGDEVREPA